MLLKKPAFLLAFLLLTIGAVAQTSYRGFIDKYPVELVTSIYSDGEATAIYTYTNFDEPIILSGKFQQGRLTLVEKDKEQKAKASLTFANFTANASRIDGNWTDLRSGRQLKINLSTVFSLDEGDDQKEGELLQPVSLGKHYFKVLVTKSKDDAFAKVSGVKILEKKTDRLVQQLAVDCQLLGLNSIDTGDYNFDGLTDFSVFEASYAGPNTSRLYFLFDPKTASIVDSGFTGTSLEFDNKRKRIFERSQCCAGTSVTTAEYKVVQNKMVLVKQQCFKWDEKKQALVEHSWKDCR